MKNAPSSLRPSLSLGACLLAATVVTYCPSARGQTSDHARKAQVAYDLQDWAGAIREFQAAYQADQRPEYLWGLGQAQRLSGDHAAAIVSFKAFRRAEVTPTQVTAADQQIARCEAELAKKEREKEAEAARRAAEAQAQSAPPAPPPEHRAAAAATAETAPAENGDPKPFYADVLGDALLVAGLGAAGAGAYFLFKGNADMRSASTTATFRQYDSGSSQASMEQTAGVIALASGGLLVGGAVFRFLTLDSKRPQERTGLTVGPLGVAWNGKF